MYTSLLHAAGETWPSEERSDSLGLFRHLDWGSPAYTAAALWASSCARSWRLVGAVGVTRERNGLPRQPHGWTILRRRWLGRAEPGESDVRRRIHWRQCALRGGREHDVSDRSDDRHPASVLRLVRLVRRWGALVHPVPLVYLAPGFALASGAAPADCALPQLPSAGCHPASGPRLVCVRRVVRSALVPLSLPVCLLVHPPPASCVLPQSSAAR